MRRLELPLVDCHQTASEDLGQVSGRDDAEPDDCRFERIEKVKPYKDGYRARLDALSLIPDEQARVVDEVRVAFTLNQQLFDELTVELPPYLTHTA